MAHHNDYCGGRGLGRDLQFLAQSSTRTFAGHSLDVTAIELVGSHLFSASYVMTVRRWDLGSGLCAAVFVGNQRAVLGVCVASGGLYTAGADRTVQRFPIYEQHVEEEQQGKPNFQLKYMCL